MSGDYSYRSGGSIITEFDRIVMTGDFQRRPSAERYSITA
jgi:hypothetical protein